jgi:gamma-glutamylcyclotransferase
MAERFLYFAYGSNMLTQRLTTRGRAPSAQFQSTGFIKGYKLTFDKISNERKSGRRSGKCDMEATAEPAARVYGVLFSIASAEEPALDKKEGVGKGYEKAQISVQTAVGVQTATAYIATTDAKDATLLPYHWYREYVLQGAIEHGLPAEYIDQVRAVSSQADPDPERRATNEAALARNADVR